jgi:general secretion pathway protein D
MSLLHLSRIIRAAGLLSLAVSAHAQEPQASPQDAPPGVPPPVPGLPAEAIPPIEEPAAGPNFQPAQQIAPAANLGATRIIEDIIEPKLSGNQLAGLYRKYTGRRVIVSSAASQAEFAFVQEASPQDPLTYAQAAELLKKAATIENFVFVPDSQDPNLDILTMATGGIRPTARGVDVYNENDTLPEGDAVISYVMTLDYIKPAEAVNTFTQIIGQFGAYGSIAAVPNAAAVVITENTSLIRKLIDLKGEIDKPGSVQATRFIPVQFADVTEIASLLTELLTAQQSTQTTAGVQRADAAPAAAPPGGEIPGQPGASSAGEATPVQIVPEPRTNRIFAMGRPVDLIFIEGLVREFDIPTSDKTFLRRKLRFLTVSEFLPIAGDALTRAFSGTGESSAGAGSGRSSGRSQPTGTNRASQTSSGTGGGSGGSFGGASGSFGGSSGSFGGGSRSGGGSSSLGDSNISSAPESMLVGRTLLVADNITNSIVAQGPPSALEIIERLLDQIDVKPEQVMISTIIGQLTLNKNIETGFDYLVRSGDVVGRAGGGFGPILPILPSTDPGGFDPGALAGGGLRAYGTVGDLNIFMRALQSKTDFTVLSRPSIFTANNQKGVISSGERIAIPTEGGTTSGTYSSGTRIQYQDVVLKLEVIPLVNDDNEITMTIALLNDEQSGTQIIEGAGTNGGNLTVPRIITREILTTATVPNNNTIVLGGLIVSRDNVTKSGVPILSDIPYLGRLFSSDLNNKDRTELMIFIQPSIVKSARALNDVQADMDARYKVSADSRNFADGPGVLPNIDDIPRAVEDGKNRTQLRQPAAASRPAASNVRPSLRPAHRR